LSSSTRDLTAAGSEALAGDRLAELLSVIAEAPDFATAAGFLVEQFALACDASRGCFLVLDPVSHALFAAAWHGFDAAPPQARAPLDDFSNPVALSALALCPVVESGGGAGRLGLPFDHWAAVPFPQPQFRGAPVLLGERQVADLRTDGFVLCAPPADDRRRIGHAPLGVAVLECSPSQEALASLAHAALLAGPVLSRMIAVDDFRRSAERLDQQRDLLTAIVNSLPDPIVITDARNDMVVQNRRAEHLLVAREGDSEGRRRAVEINNLLFTSFLAKSMMGGAAPSGARELNLVDPDEGADLLFEVIAHPLGSTASRDPSFVSVLRDVTDLRRAAGELERQVQRVRLAEIDARRERDRLNLILENVADPILVTDAQSNIILMNRQAEQLFQLGEAPSRARAAAVRGNDTKFTTFISDFTIGGEHARRAQMRLTQPGSGVELPVEVVSGKILNQRGEPLAIVSVLHDLTKQVENERLYEELKRFSSQLEERIRAATTDLAEQNTRLQWQARELERASRLKSDFLASMSHELRTPINALLGYSSLMLDRIYGDVNAKQEEALKRVQGSANHLLALINDILDLAKIEAGKMPMHLETIILRHVVTEISAQIEPMLRRKPVEFDCQVPNGLPPMYTDRTKVKQILLNLLSNAVKFTPKGRVSLTATLVDDRVRIDVADTGIGIREQDLEAIFEDFRQVDQSRTREFGGTGLGLSITRKLVGQLGGKVEVRSTYGEGSTFTLELPVHCTTRVDEAGSMI
jgi:PAS domain S-box-containing protein